MLFKNRLHDTLALIWSIWPLPNGQAHASLPTLLLQLLSHCPHEVYKSPHCPQEQCEPSHFPYGLCEVRTFSTFVELDIIIFDSLSNCEKPSGLGT